MKIDELINKLTIKAYDITCVEPIYQECIRKLEELQKYKAIGTVEECKEAADKQVAKKVIDSYTRYDFNGEYDGDFCNCPNCKNEIIDGYNLDEYYKYCVHCGQKIEWRE